MRISEKTLGSRVEGWVAAFPSLGLTHWKIDTTIVDTEEGEPNAEVTPSMHYDTARIEFRKGFLEESNEEEIDLVILHELVHVAMRDLERALELPEAHLGMPARALWMDALDHHREGLVDRLARALYYAYSANVVQS